VIKAVRESWGEMRRKMVNPRSGEFEKSGEISRALPLGELEM
jgi:hypothetical protein